MSKSSEHGIDSAEIKVESKSNESFDATEPSSDIPPDGGWGWVVVFVSFITNFMGWGTLLSSGVFLEEFCEVMIKWNNYFYSTFIIS